MKKLTIGPEKITIRGLSGIKEVNWKDIAFFERFEQF